MCLTLLRILFMSVDDYKEDLAAWIAGEYNINLSASNISAGVDFSGLIIILNDTELADSEDLPFVVTTKHLFLHLDFWESLLERTVNFDRISLQGVELTLKKSQDAEKKTVQPLPTTDSLQTVFLQQLDQFSVKDSHIYFKDHLGVDKTIVIENLRWLNNGDIHQGVGSASLPESLGDNSLEFIIDLSGEKGDPDNPLRGELYVEADNLNIGDYLIDRVNPYAQIDEAVLGFQAWAEFSLTKLHQAQIVFNDSQLVWSQSDKQHNWRLNSGLLQLTNNGEKWLLDSYDLDIEHNQKKRQDLTVSGYGTAEEASFIFNELYLQDLLPFYLLNSDLTKTELSLLQALAPDAELKRLAISKNRADKLQFSAQLAAFKNYPKGAIPGLSNAHIDVQGGASQGEINIRLPKQKIYFDGQFSRAMPVESGNLALHWAVTPAGLKLFSEQSLLKTADLDTVTEFSLLFPNKEAKNQSPFLSLYSYASLNDAGKAQYYYPVKAMKEKVFGYLQPTLKKGEVKGAKILWYGALNHYPYKQHDGIFQAWVPLRDAQYDFYGQWQGLTDLDLDLLFENDWLTMNALQASLGQVKVQKLTARIDHLNPNGVLTINADINEEAQKISDYLKASPLKASVGKALTVIKVQKPLSGHLQLNIPFNRKKQQTETLGEVTLSDNNINIELAENNILPLKNVQGKFSFINGNLTAKNIAAQLFEQDLHISFATLQKKENYQVNVDLDSVWDLQQLSSTLPQLVPLQLSGNLDWTGNVKFEHPFSGGYKSRITLSSATQGVTSKLPFPFNKNALHSWPTTVFISGDHNSSTFFFNIQDKLDFIGKLDYQDKQPGIPYFALNIGADRVSDVDTKKHLIKVDLDRLDISDWYKQWTVQANRSAKNKRSSVVELDQIKVDIKHATLFEQPLSALKIDAVNDKQKWSADISSDNLQAKVEYHSGVPLRLDLDIKELNFQALDLSTLNKQQEAVSQQRANLQEVYPEIFAKCTSCIYGGYDLSPLQLHLYPNKKLLNIDYIDIGTKEEFTHITGGWDQSHTNITIDSLADEKNSIVKRLGFTSPVEYQQAELNGTFNWLGAPWQFNFNSLNGAFSASLKDGSITEVSDKGARLLSIFSLDGIRRSLNLEFDNVFAKGLNFDKFTLSATISEGVVNNDDFYLNGSAGKITGNGLLDLVNNDTNYEFSYSPAVTSSLPLLTAFAINPLTGAAVLVMSKLLEPVVETIVRVDFSVKGPLDDPAVKLISREKGKVKLQNSELLEEITEQQFKGNEANE